MLVRANVTYSEVDRCLRTYGIDGTKAFILSPDMCDEDRAKAMALLVTICYNEVKHNI